MTCLLGPAAVAPRPSRVVFSSAAGLIITVTDGDRRGSHRSNAKQGCATGPGPVAHDGGRSFCATATSAVASMVLMRSDQTVLTLADLLRRCRNQCGYMADEERRLGDSWLSSWPHKDAHVCVRAGLNTAVRVEFMARDVPSQAGSKCST
jgi:hypothetical protein